MPHPNPLGWARRFRHPPGVTPRSGRRRSRAARHRTPSPRPRRRTAYKGPERVYIIHIGGERHMYWVIRVGVRADVVDAKGPEHLLPERRGQPVRAGLDIVVGDNPWH